MFLRALIPHFLGIGVSMFLLDFPIVGPFSTSRVGFLLIFGSFVLRILSSKKIFKIPKFENSIVISFFFVFMAVAISSVYHMTEISRIVSWIFLFLTIIIFPRFLNKREEGKLVIKSIAIYSFIFLIVLIVYCIHTYGVLAFTNKSMRYGIDELPPGLNRITNGVVFANIYILIYFFIFKSILARYFVIVAFVVSFWFVLSTYTRQGFISESVLLVGFLISIYTSSKNRLSTIFLVGLVVFFAFYNILLSDIFIDNFVRRSRDQLENDEGSTAYRAYLYRRGLEFIENNFFAGIGPDNFLNYVGKDAHSGYLSIVSETGVLSIVSILILVVSSVINVVRNYRRRLKTHFFWIMLTVLIAPLFKTIYHLPMFWTGIIVVFFYNNYVIEYEGRSRILLRNSN